MHAFLDHQLLRQRLGLRRIGLRNIAIDDFNRIVADLVAVKGEPGVDAGLEVLALQREGAGERTDYTHLDRIGIGNGTKTNGRDGGGDPHFHDFLPIDPWLPSTDPGCQIDECGGQSKMK